MEKVTGSSTAGLAWCSPNGRIATAACLNRQLQVVLAKQLPRLIPNNQKHSACTTLSSAYWERWWQSSGLSGSEQLAILGCVGN